MTDRGFEFRIDTIARRQHGVFSRVQVTGAGGTTAMVHRRLEAGRWLRLMSGVYALPSHPFTWHRSLMAAVLGEQAAVVGGKAAAALHQIDGFPRARPEIVVPRGSNHRNPLATVRERDGVRTTVVDGIPVLTLCDTLFAIAALVPERRTAMALDDSMTHHGLRLVDVQARYLGLAVHPRRRGMATMRRLIEQRSAAEFSAPESTLEHDFYAILDGPGMPRYRRQVTLPWAPEQRVDAMLASAPVILEADSRDWHTRVADFDRDRRRDRLAALHGYLTLRFTHADIRHHPGRVADEVRSIVDRAA